MSPQLQLILKAKSFKAYTSVFIFLTIRTIKMQCFNPDKAILSSLTGIV